MVSIIALLILIVLLTLFGVYYNKLNDFPYPDSQDNCPKLWKSDGSGNCVNPSSVEVTSNFLPPQGSWQNNTPGYVNYKNGIFNPKDTAWNSYDGAMDSICGKQKWAAKYNIIWNGVTTYNKC